MIYRILRFLFRITNWFYFRKLQVKGLENIPSKGPVFLVANHPSAFMDPMIVATVTKRPLFFLAKGAVFQGKFSKWLLPKFNLIPIYRSHETPGETHKNKDVFIQCYKHLAKGGALLAFPEGVSLTERKLKKIQSGTARICLGAEAANNYSLNIRIVTVGLNYSDPHKFQSDLFVNIDEPIEVSDFYEAYRQDSFKGAHALTDEIRKRLEKQVVAIQDTDVDKLVSDIELIYKSQLLVDLGHSPKEMLNDFNTTKAISESVHYFIEKDPMRVERMKKEIGSYKKALQQLSLSDQDLKGTGRSSPVLDTLKALTLLILGSPFFLFGFIHSYIPFRIPFWTARLINRRPEFYGSLAYTIGTFVFILIYGLEIAAFSCHASDWKYTLIYALSLPLTGLLAFYYYRYFTSVKGSWKLLSLFYKKTDIISKLISERKAIIEELEKGRKEFVSYRDGTHPSNEVKQ